MALFSSFSCTLFFQTVGVKFTTGNMVPAFCLVFKSFLITYPMTFFEHRCHLQPCRPCEYAVSLSISFQVVISGKGTKRKDCFKPHCGYWGTTSLREIPLPDWKLEWHVPVQTPRGGVSFLSPLPLHPPDKFQAMQNWLLRVNLPQVGRL